LAGGRVLSEGTVEQVQADPKVQEVYLGTAAAGALPPAETNAGESMGAEQESDEAKEAADAGTR
ncbi:hypothetical protein ACFWWS_40380, partial [Streptomyces sp. NPDC059083]